MNPKTIRPHRYGFSHVAPIQVIPTVRAIIPKAQIAVPTMYGRSAVTARGRSEILSRATQIATAHARADTMNAGADTPGASCSRIGAAAPAAP